YFFFQAEDGIRDFHVTGVQTCALPIFASAIATPSGISISRMMPVNSSWRSSASWNRSDASVCSNQVSPSQKNMLSPNVSWTEKLDRKSTRLNSSHVKISYAVFCLKKKI